MTTRKSDEVFQLRVPWVFQVDNQDPRSLMGMTVLGGFEQYHGTAHTAHSSRCLESQLGEGGSVSAMMIIDATYLDQGLFGNGA